jgi:DNA-binding NtrC family response regulator
MELTMKIDREKVLVIASDVYMRKMLRTVFERDDYLVFESETCFDVTESVFESGVEVAVVNVCDFVVKELFDLLSRFPDLKLVTISDSFVTEEFIKIKKFAKERVFFLKKPASMKAVVSTVSQVV